MALRRILGYKRDKPILGWKKFHNDGLCNLYSSPNIIRVMKSRTDNVGRVCSMNGSDAECIQHFSKKI
jgi:hypothetical protein